MLDESYSSHPNFFLFFETQLFKTKALRTTLEEFIRKQDFRFSREISSEESKGWQTALAVLTGVTGIFTNEMTHDLSQKAESKRGSRFQPQPVRLELNGRQE